MDLELIEALRGTGAVRAFTDEPVDEATIAAVLDDARFAPSGGNRQPWRVCVVRDAAVRRRLGDLMQEVFDEYIARNASGVPAFSTASTPAAGPITRHVNPLIEAIETVPVVLVVAADLGSVAMMDGELDRRPITGGASIYPFCWSILLTARAYGLGGVMTTFLARAEPAAAPLLALPPDHAVAATLFLGHPQHQPTKLRRRAVSEFATLDRFDGPPLGGS